MLNNIKCNNYKKSSLQMNLIYLLMFLLVFDPGNRIFKLKMPVFILITFIALCDSIIKKLMISKEITIMTCMFFSLGLLSFLIGLLLDVNFNIGFGISKLSAFAFMFLMMIFSMYDIDFYKCLVKVLDLLVIVIIMIAIIVLFDAKNLINILYDFGNKNVSFTINFRCYGGIQFTSIYFHSSPLMIIGLMYNFNKFFEYFKLTKTNRNKREIVTKRNHYFVWAVLTGIAMFLTGSRNNMLFSIVSIAILILYYSKNKAKVLIFYLCVALTILFLFNDVIFGMFNIAEESNNTKIKTLYEYIKFFENNPIVIFIGQGIGGMYYSEVRNAMVAITELSYLDIFRWWGIFAGSFVIFIMISPLINIVKECQKENAWIFIAYFIFLIMIAFNPFFFNSTGIIFFAIINDIVFKTRRKNVNKCSIMHI